MTTTLRPDSYYIQSLATGNYIGRNVREDRSLNPKPILHLGKGIQEPPIWKAAETDDGFILFASGSPVAPRNDGVYAILLHEEYPYKWKLINSVTDGPDCFIVQAAHGYKGWRVDDTDDFSPIGFRPLIAIPTYPPRYPPQQVFRFIKVEEDVASASESV